MVIIYRQKNAGANSGPGLHETKFPTFSRAGGI